ncbi:MAG: TetR/AcrR family transcriptional regulator [Balneolaceae bacterium]|nr:TetR/AcrR family transcriptional regulator [Balneolaceae bacterium]
MVPRTPEQNEEIREQTRKEIKNAAFELFASEGYARTPISKIAETAGVSKGLIYHYFDSKEQILESIFRDLSDLGRELVNEEGEQSDLSPAEQLEQMLTGLFAFLEESSELIRLMISLSLQPDAIATIEPYVEEENRRQVQVLSALFEQMGYNNPEQEAYYLAAKLDGIALGYISMGEDYPYQQIKKKIIDEYVHHEKNS